jgi:hypothetical protein
MNELLVKWKEEGQRRQKLCKSEREKKRLEKMLEEKEIEKRRNIQQPSMADQWNGIERRKSSRSVSLRAQGGGVVEGISAAVRSKTESADQKEIEKCVSTLEKLYAKTYVELLKATGQKEGWTENEIEKARKGAAIQFKINLPRCGSGLQREIFVACVIAGIALDVYAGKEASQLLYAAQVMSTKEKKQ